MPEDVAIAVQGVSKSFRLPHERYTGIKQAIIKFRPGRKFELQHVLKNISFEIKKGDFFAIVGRNGSGKSTLLKVLAQIYTPEKGGVHINGSLTPFIELGVGFNPELTGRENVFLNGALLGFDRRQTAEMYDDIVRFAELKPFMDQKLKNYSSGMQVRLAFSVAIRAKSDILLVDEVLAVGDSAFQQKCFNYFEELKKQGRTVVFVSHDMSSVQRFCNRAVYIDKGRLALEGTPSEVADMYTLDNIQSIVHDVPGNLSSEHKVRARIAKQTDAGLTLGITYQSQDQDELYAGLSIIRDGVSVAEIISLGHVKMVGNGTISYDLDTTMLNAGVYEITVVLCRKQNRELLAVNKAKTVFVVKNEDKTKGAALRLKDGWKAE